MAPQVVQQTIGGALDQVMHEILGIKDQTWQSLYHFTVGGVAGRCPSQDDPALRAPWQGAVR